MTIHFRHATPHDSRDLQGLRPFYEWEPARIAKITDEVTAYVFPNEDGYPVLHVWNMSAEHEGALEIILSVEDHPSIDSILLQAANILNAIDVTKLPPFT